MLVSLFCIGNNRASLLRIKQTIKKTLKKKSNRLYYEKKKLGKWYVLIILLSMFTQKIHNKALK